MIRRLFLASLAVLSLAAGKPLAIALAPGAQSVTEGQGATFLLSKSGGNGRPTAVRVTASDGSYAALVMPGSSFTVPTRDDAIVNGTRTVTLTATASTGATARAVLKILDNDTPAPTPTPTPTPVPSALIAGGYARVIAAEQSVPKVAAAMGYTYGEAVYRTVQAGEIVKLGLAAPELGCACAGARREWEAFGLDGKFIGYLWESNLEGVSPAP